MKHPDINRFNALPGKMFLNPGGRYVYYNDHQKIVSRLILLLENVCTTEDMRAILQRELDGLGIPVKVS